MKFGESDLDVLAGKQDIGEEASNPIMPHRWPATPAAHGPPNLGTQVKALNRAPPKSGIGCLRPQILYAGPCAVTSQTLNGFGT